MDRQLEIVDLEEDRSYIVTELEMIDTESGMRTVAHIDDAALLLLPQHFTLAFEKDEELFYHLTAAANVYKLFITKKKDNIVEFIIS